MKETKLIPMVDFILEIDLLNTKEFCEKYNIPIPVFTGNVKTSANQFLQVDAIKQRIFTDYAKFLYKDIKEEMFIGDKPIFSGFIKCTPSYASKNGIEKSFDDFGQNEFSITIYKVPEKTYNIKGKTFCTSFHLKKIGDLVNMGLTYNNYN